MASSSSSWQPEWRVPPGEILAEELETRGISQSELARRMDRPVKTINEIVHAKAALTADTALQLELTLGISASFWTGLETNYRRQLARQKALEEFEDHVPWAKEFPLPDLKRLHIVDADAGRGGSMVAELLSFFGVSSVKAWERQWSSPLATFRRSTTFESSPHATAAWLRWGEVRAAEVATSPFDAEAILSVLVDARPMTREEPFADVIDELRDRLATSGVVLVLTPELQGAPISGAARWLDPQTALVQLSLRHKSDDHFWFSFYHEAAHLLEDRRVDFVDAEANPTPNPDSDAEHRADRRARELLIEPEAYARFVETNHFETTAVRDFAREQNIAPGIVVGRLQRDKHVSYGQLNPLKKKIAWSSA
jgi:HTH-type transcriptional regulator/antitoxin HigA